MKIQRIIGDSIENPDAIAVLYNAPAACINSHWQLQYKIINGWVLARNGINWAAYYNHLKIKGYLIGYITQEIKFLDIKNGFYQIREASKLQFQCCILNKFIVTGRAKPGKPGIAKHPEWKSQETSLSGRFSMRFKVKENVE